MSRESIATVAPALSAALASLRKRVRQEVVRIVNQLYASIVARVIPAKLGPNLYDCQCQLDREVEDETHENTTNERNLQSGRDDMKNDRREQEGDTPVR